MQGGDEQMKVLNSALSGVRVGRGVSSGTPISRTI